MATLTTNDRLDFGTKYGVYYPEDGYFDVYPDQETADYFALATDGVVIRVQIERVEADK